MRLNLAFKHSQLHLLTASRALNTSFKYKWIRHSNAAGVFKHCVCSLSTLLDTPTLLVHFVGVKSETIACLFLHRCFWLVDYFQSSSDAEVFKSCSSTAVSHPLVPAQHTPTNHHHVTCSWSVKQ